MFTGLLEEITKQIGDLSSQNTELQAFLRSILQVHNHYEELEGFVMRVG